MPMDADRSALLLIDVINAMDFDDGPALLENFMPAAREVAALKSRALAADVPVIYCNDNFGAWREEFSEMVRQYCESDLPGAGLCRLLAPDHPHYSVLKPANSGFYGTTLEVLLRYLGVRRLILTGVTTDICILFTANDAYMRDYDLVIPHDGVAAVERHTSEMMLEYMRNVLKATTPGCAEIAFTRS